MSATIVVGHSRGEVVRKVRGTQLCNEIGSHQEMGYDSMSMAVGCWYRNGFMYSSLKLASVSPRGGSSGAGANVFLVISTADEATFR